MHVAAADTLNKKARVSVTRRNFHIFVYHRLSWELVYLEETKDFCLQNEGPIEKMEIDIACADGENGCMCTSRQQWVLVNSKDDGFFFDVLCDIDECAAQIRTSCGLPNVFTHGFPYRQGEVWRRVSSIDRGNPSWISQWSSCLPERELGVTEKTTQLAASNTLG